MTAFDKLNAEIAALATLSSERLRERWAEVTGQMVPRVSHAMLRLALAWELQARMLGGHSRATLRTLARLASAKTRTTAALPGMRLVREWNGVVHVVTVGDGGQVRWQDQDYGSLSEVARAITGTRWSGPAFFGLRTKVAA